MGTAAPRRVWSFVLAAFTVLPAGLLAAAKLWGADNPWATALPSLQKLGPGVLPRGDDSIHLSAAKGECEGAQIVAPPPISEVRVRAGPLTAGGAEPLSVALYREVFMPVAEPSNSEGRPGRWPDPLVPAVDAYAGQERAAFPASSAGPEPVAIFLEVCVPTQARPGSYRGEVELSARDKSPLRMSVSLEVHRFAIPATSSLPNTFGFSGISACRGHGHEPDPRCVARLTRLYATAALRHRISLHGMSMEPPPIASQRPLRLDFRSYDAELAPFMDGTILPTGARFTTTDVRPGPPATTEAQRVDYWRAFASHLRERGWLERAFVYAKDEPRAQDLPEVRRFAALVHRADPDLRVLVTASLDPLLEGAADILAPNINCLFARGYDGYCGHIVPLSAYRAARAQGAQLWWYQSCGSHGCGEVPPLDLKARDYFRGWPSYAIDHDAALNRAMGVLAFRYGVGGELYYNTVEAYLPAEPDAPPHQKTTRGAAVVQSIRLAPPDPWQGAWRFHGNGDGTLFYPGLPARIGGTLEIPVESLRLKYLRDGMEDYEYLRLARSLGLERDAQRFARSLAPEAYAIARAPLAWEHARERLALCIEQALASRGE